LNPGGGVAIFVGMASLLASSVSAIFVGTASSLASSVSVVHVAALSSDFEMGDGFSQW
jgi:hypothetical protein